MTTTKYLARRVVGAVCVVVVLAALRWATGGAL